MAQTASSPPPDPLAPKLSTDPRNLPRFQKFDKPEQIQIGPPPLVFSEPPSAAGDTGFDSSNSRKAKAKKAKVKPKPPKAAQALAGTPPPQTVSPYQKPSKDSAAGAFAAAPGSPPVELGPIRQKPKKRKAHVEPDDPYAPLGVHAGAFTLFPAIELIGGYDTNPAHVNCVCSPGAGLYTIAPELQVQSNWSRHELKADLRGSYSGYKPDETPTLSRPYFNGKVDGRVDVTKTTRIDISGRALVSADNPGSPNLQADLAKLPIFTTLGGSFGLGQRFNRFDFSLKGDVERTSYQHSSLTDGTTASNDDRNYNQYGVILRGGYELTPGVTPFVEFDADTRKHDLNSDLSGYQRDSKGMTGKVGTTFELSRLLTGEVALGYTRRNYEDPRLDPLKGLIGSASLIWTANALTTAKLTASSTVAESTIAGVSGVLSRDIGLQVDHSFRRWLIGTAKLGFGVDSYHGTDAGVALCDCVVTTPGGTFADRVDKRFYAGLGLTYKLNRSVQVKGEVRHDWMRSNISNNDFNATTFLLGVRIQQ
ncbi:MAG: outer membrane beta-barrel protein [Pseudolabrys sp.]